MNVPNVPRGTLEVQDCRTGVISRKADGRDMAHEMTSGRAPAQGEEASGVALQDPGESLEVVISSSFFCPLSESASLWGGFLWAFYGAKWGVWGRFCTEIRGICAGIGAN